MFAVRDSLVVLQPQDLAAPRSFDWTQSLFAHVSPTRVLILTSIPVLSLSPYVARPSLALSSVYVLIELPSKQV